jgi:hypothetical protein
LLILLYLLRILGDRLNGMKELGFEWLKEELELGKSMSEESYMESLLLTWDSVLYTIPCIWIPAGWNATLSSVSPCDLWTVRAHACLIRHCFWIFSRTVFDDVDTSFDIHKIGVQSLPLFELYI